MTYKKILKLLSMLLFLWFCIHIIYTINDGNKDEGKSADIAVILGTTVNTDGTLSERLEKRMECGLRLYKDGRVKKIIVDKLGVDESEVTNDASFTNDLGADSLDTVELIMEFEKEFNISIPDEQAETITTVGQAVTYLEEHAK